MEHREYQRDTGSKTGIIFIHGMLGTPNQFLKIDGEIEKHGYDSHIILLPGHGKTAKELWRETCQNWLQYSHACIQKMRLRYEKLYLAGHSMGGLLCLNYASENQADGLILINTPAKAMTSSVQFKRSARLILPFLPTDNAYLMAHEEIMGVTIHQFYEYIMLAKPILEVAKLIDITRKRLSEVRTPTLIMQSKFDELIRYKSAYFLQENIPGAERDIVFLNNSSHALYADEDEQWMIRNILTFIQ